MAHIQLDVYFTKVACTAVTKTTLNNICNSSHRLAFIRLQHCFGGATLFRFEPAASKTAKMPSSADRYTNPELREEIKEEVKEGDKGGRPGQWSARKAQLMASEYKKRGGGYTTDENHKDARQKHLDKWTEEEWQTSEGSAHAKQADGTETRYLPKAAWEKMSEEEKRETNEKKLEESREGKQFVGNTAEAKQARKDATRRSEVESEEEEFQSEHSETAASRGSKGEKTTETNQSEIKEDAETGKDEAIDKANEKNGEDRKPVPKKRGAAAEQKGSSKKQRRDSATEEPSGTAGDKTRVPEKGQKVQWHSLPGYVNGEVVEVAYEEKTVEGKTVKASKNDPRVVLRSEASGKIAVHKPQAVYF